MIVVIFRSFLPPRKGERCMKTKCIYKQDKIMVSPISYNKILVSLAKIFFSIFMGNPLYTNQQFMA